MIKWIKDVDTGELYPVQNDFEFETPAHLEIPEYTTIDYDKTKEMTITELQNQLIAAQNHIEAIESEKTSDNNSAVNVNEVSLEFVSKSERWLNTDVNYEGKSKSFDFLASLQFVGVILLACIVFAMGIYVFANENNIEISIPNISEQQTVDYELTIVPEIGSIPIYSSEQGTSLYLTQKEQEQPQEQQEISEEQTETDPLYNWKILLFRFLSIVITILGFRLGIGFVMKIMRCT